jgi:hypothetical protein
VYVDYDPVVLARARALLASAITLIAILHHVSDYGLRSPMPRDQDVRPIGTKSRH